jgi:hypothetical protein
MTIINETINILIDKHIIDSYTNYLRNKSVIIVGPDTNLIGKSLGKHIDSFDIVIRHNTVFEYLPFNDKLAEDFGTKTHVLYFSPQCIKDYSFKPDTLTKIKKLKDFGLKYIIYQNGNKDGKYIQGDYCFCKELLWFKKEMFKLNIAMHYSHNATKELTKLMCNEKKAPCIPRVGFLSIFDMIIHQAKSIEIIGMSFYHGGGHAFRPKAMQVLDPSKNAYGSTSGTHDSIIEIALLRKFMEYYDKIKYDFPV